MRFSHPGDSGEKLLDQYHGTVTEIVNKISSGATIACMTMI